MKYLTIAVVVSCVMALSEPTLPAQTPPTPAQAVPASTTPAWSPAQSISLFAFPRNNQSADQQLRDEADCYGLAKQRTGIDAQAPVPTGPSAEEIAAAQKQAAENASQMQGGRALGAARGAAGGAAIGAIAGNAGKGAAAGAVAGTMQGGMAQRAANAQSQQQAAAQAAAAQKKAAEELKRQHEEGLDTFQRAFSACMDARGYSVK